MNNINNIVKGYSKIDLEKNYKEALKDNNFKEFVNKKSHKIIDRKDEYENVINTLERNHD